MAEIRIEKKKPVWPWILLILLILAAIFFFWYYNDQAHMNDRDEMENDTITEIDETSIYTESSIDSTPLYYGTYGTVKKEKALADYFTYLDNNRNIAGTREYNNTAFEKLIAATQVEAQEQNVDISANLNKARENVLLFRNDSIQVKDANIEKIAASEISDGLKIIQQQKFPSLISEAEELRMDALMVEDKMLKDKKNEKLSAFFNQAALLLQKMHNKEQM